MSAQLRILLLEDTPSDAELEEYYLQKAGISFVMKRVETEEGFIRALTEFAPDIILADYHLPTFDGLLALAIARQQQPEIPFLFVTGAMGEEVAVESLKQGAKDYILKDRMSRLGPAVQRAMAESAEQSRLKRAEQAVRDSQANLMAAQRIAHLGDLNWDIEANVLKLSQEVFDILETPADRFGGTYEDFLALICPGDLGLFATAVNQALIGSNPLALDFRIVAPDGCEHFIHAQAEIVYGPTGKPQHMVGTLQDVTERKRGELALRKVNRAMKTLSQCNEALVHAEGEAQLLQEMCRIIVEAGQYSLAWVAFAEEEGDKAIVPVALYGREPTHIADIQANWSAGMPAACLVAETIRTGLPQTIQAGAMACSEFKTCCDKSQSFGFAAALSLPLKHNQDILGALNIYASEPHTFDQAGTELLGELANDLAFGIVTLRARVEQQNTLQQLESSMERTVQAICATVEMRDPYTAGHQRRVADIASAIAAEMGLPADQIRGLHLAGIVHDLGKIHIPAEILSKPAKLSKIEYMLIQTHPQTAYNILKDVSFPWPVANAVLQHHERLDGSGYPDGLKEGEIILEARILAVADVVEAMASHRPYRAGLGIDAALAEVEKQRGTLYDAEVVDACLTLFRDKGFVLSE